MAAALEASGFERKAAWDFEWLGHPASLYEDGLAVYLHSVEDKEHLLEQPGAYERMLADFEERRRQIVGSLTAQLGPPEADQWDLGKARLRVEVSDGGPEAPTSLSLVVRR